MSVENVSEFKSYNARPADHQSPPDVEKETADKRAQADKKVADNDVLGITQRIEDPEKASNESEPDKEAILERLRSVNEQFPLKSTSLVFEFDDANDPPIIKVVDKESGDVIREIPPRELREIAKALSDIADNLNSESGKLQDKYSSGILINEQL